VRAQSAPLAILVFALPFWIAAAPAADPNPQLGFFVVSEEPAADLRFHDSPQYPRLGYIAARPDLIIAELESVSVATRREHSRQLDSKGNIVEQSDDNRPCLEIQLLKRDSKAFEAFTSAHRGKQVLLMLDGDALMAPFISATISAKTIQVSIPKGVDADVLRRRLLPLVRQLSVTR
jgi:hypothetical protein